MNSRIHDFSPFTALAACSLALCACQSNTHTMTDVATGKTVVCQECYDAVTAAHRDHPHESPVIMLLPLVALAGLAVFAVYRHEVFRVPAFAGLASLGLALFAAAIGWDAVADPTRTTSWWTEETLEFGGALSMLAGFQVRHRHVLTLAGVSRDPLPNTPRTVDP